MIELEWQTPKVDWYGAQDEGGVYTGDRFNASDYNRIKNNLKYLRELAILMYESFAITDMGSDKKAGENFYASEINKLEQNLEHINQKTLSLDCGSTKTYSTNGHTFDYNELNRLEGASLRLYDNLTNQHDGRRMFTWNFGMKAGL